MITVCVVTQDNYYDSRLCIENLISKANFRQMELYIADNGSKDRRVFDFGKEVADFHGYKTERTPYGEFINEMIKSISTEWICIFPIGNIVNQNWLADLYFTTNLFEKSGAVGISNSFKKGHLVPMLTSKDEMNHVWQPDNGNLNGVILFRQSLLNGIGGFDPQLDNEFFAQMQFTYRLTRAGRQCFYMAEQYSVDVMKKESSTEDMLKYNESLKTMDESKNYKLEF